MSNSANFNNYLNPSDFISSSSINKGLQYQHNYIFNLNIGSKLMKLGLNCEDIRWNAIDVSVPGVSMNVTGNVHAGRNRYNATERSDQDLRVTFLEDSSMSFRRVFEKWIALAYDPYTSKREYPDLFRDASIDIYTLNNSGISTYLDQFIKVFPIQINDLDFGISKYDIVKTEVTFKFYSHLVKKYSEINKQIQE